MSRRYTLTAVFSAVIALIFSYLTLTPINCPPRVLDCIEGKAGGWPLEYRNWSGGAVGYFKMNYLNLFVDWLLFFLVVMILTTVLLKVKDKLLS